MVKSCLSFAVILGAVLVPRAASAVQSAELYTEQAYFYGRFEARIRFAPDDGVVSSFFLWKNGSSSTTSWNELDFEKINAACRLQTNIWTGTGTQSAEIDTPSFNICSDYHTYAFEWTPDYIAWLIDGNQVRKVTGSSVTQYTQNASQGMTLHFNTWEGNSTFGGTLDPSMLPVHEFISWVQYSSYSNGAFQVQWRQEFDGSSMPAGWDAGNWSSVYNLSTHNPANVTFAGGIAVLSMTADNATGFSGAPPADSAATGGAPGTGGATATGGVPGTGGAKGSGGASAGGSTGSAGASASGGNHGTAGTSGTGGSPGTGGAPATGGNTGTGGGSATGGDSGATGGAPGTGGATAATGGAPGTGGGGPAGEAPGSSSGCSCRTIGDRPDGAGALAIVLLIAAYAFRRRSRV